MGCSQGGTGEMLKRGNNTSMAHFFLVLSYLNWSVTMMNGLQLMDGMIRIYTQDFMMPVLAVA